MKKELISPIITALAMVLLIISRLIGARKLDWLAYCAIVIFIACLVVVFNTINKTK